MRNSSQVRVFKESRVGVKPAVLLPVAALAGVTWQAGRAEVVRDLSITVEPGDFVGILGPNGAGKSTVLSLLGASIRPSRGGVSIFGQNPWDVAERERVRLRTRIGVVLQRCDYNAQLPLSAQEVVAIGRVGRNGGWGNRLSMADREYVDEVMERMGIVHLAGRPYRALSGGEQQKVQLARVLAQEPEVLLLDEPATGLDLDWQERLVDLVGQLSESSGLPIVMTTHQISHLPACCRKVALMRGGRILFSGAAEKALTEERLGTLYGCAVEIIHRRGRRYCLGAGESGL